MAERNDRRRRALVWTSVVAVLMWLTPFTAPLLLPLTYLNTHLHELGHAFAAILTGGRVSSILVNADGSGLANVWGGSMPVVAMAGYVGAAAVGGGLIAASKSQDSAHAALKLMAFTMLGALIFFVRGDGVGIASGIVWTLVLFWLGSRFTKEFSQVVAAFLGIQMALTSVQAFLALYGASLYNAHSDAEIMERATGIPALVWAALWLVLSVLSVRAGWQVAWSKDGKGPKISRSGQTNRA